MSTTVVLKTMLCFMLASTAASAFVANRNVPGRADDGPLDHRNTDVSTLNEKNVGAPTPTDTVLQSGQYVDDNDAPMSNLDVPDSMRRTPSDQRNVGSNTNLLSPFVIEKNLVGDEGNAPRPTDTVHQSQDTNGNDASMFNPNVSDSMDRTPDQRNAGSNTNLFSPVEIENNFGGDEGNARRPVHQSQDANSNDAPMPNLDVPDSIIRTPSDQRSTGSSSTTNSFVAHLLPFVYGNDLGGNAPRPTYTVHQPGRAIMQKAADSANTPMRLAVGHEHRNHDGRNVGVDAAVNVLRLPRSQAASGSGSGSVSELGPATATPNATPTATDASCASGPCECSSFPVISGDPNYCDDYTSGRGNDCDKCCLAEDCVTPRSTQGSGTRSGSGSASGLESGSGSDSSGESRASGSSSGGSEDAGYAYESYDYGGYDYGDGAGYGYEDDDETYEDDDWELYLKNDASIKLKSRVLEWCENPVQAENDYGPIADWDVSEVNSFNKLFKKCRYRNPDLSRWNTSNVIDMRSTFHRARSFNADISQWLTGKVIDMSNMFERASNFSTDISEWQVGRVTNFDEMFKGAANFNSNISQWNVAKATSMYGMFSGATNFDSDISQWNVAKATSMHAMFDSARNFNADLSRWQVGNISDMSGMFRHTDKFNADISRWQTSKVRTMMDMFAYAAKFNADISRWPVTSVAAWGLADIFYSATNFNQDLSFWRFDAPPSQKQLNGDPFYKSNSSCTWDNNQIYRNDTTGIRSRISNGRFYCNDRNVKRLKDGEVCDSESTASAQTCQTTISGPSLCKGRCCDPFVNGTCLACTLDGSCYNPLTTHPTNWDPSLLDTIATGFRPSLIANEFVRVNWKSLFYPQAMLEKKDGTALPADYSTFTFQLKWLLPINATTTTTTTPIDLNVGDNPPFDMEWDDTGKGPGGIGIDSETGEIFAAPTRTGSYTAWLVAVDTSGPALDQGLPPELDQILLKKWEVEVIEPTTFEVESFKREGGDTIQDVDISTPTPKDFFFEEPWLIPEIETITTTSNGSITYAVPVNNCSKSASELGKPFLQVSLDPASGYITGIYKQPQELGSIGRETKAKFPHIQVCFLQVTAVHSVETYVGLKTATAELESFVITFVHLPPPPEASKEEDHILAALIVLAAIFAACLIAFAGYKYRQHQIKMRPVDFNTQLATMLASGEIAPEQLRSDRKPREIRRRDLVMVRRVGNGQFGEVWKCILDEMFMRGTPEYAVAAKTVLEAAQSPEATKDLLSEASVMAQVAGHRNLVSIIGVITRGDPLVLVLQYCEHGSVLDELKMQAAEGTPVTFANKMKMGLDIASGMAHLASLHFIHRDLAARNVLVADGTVSTAEHDRTGVTSTLVCKVADFGLSRGDGNGDGSGGVGEGSKESYYKSSNGVFPIRWTAPEAMEQLRFTQASDVWSFAIVVVELFQDGTNPYNGKSNPDVMTLVLSGGRHPPPSIDCTDRLYTFLLSCWHQDVAQRPTFAKVVQHFKAVVNAAAAAPPTVAVRRQSTFLGFESANNTYAGFTSGAAGEAASNGYGGVGGSGGGGGVGTSASAGAPCKYACGFTSSNAGARITHEETCEHFYMNPGGGGGGDVEAERNDSVSRSDTTSNIVSALLNIVSDADADAGNHAIVNASGVPMQRSMYGTLIEDHRGEEQPEDVPPPPTHVHVQPKPQQRQALQAGYGGLQRQELGNIAASVATDVSAADGYILMAGEVGSGGGTGNRMRSPSGEEIAIMLDPRNMYHGPVAVAAAAKLIATRAEKKRTIAFVEDWWNSRYPADKLIKSSEVAALLETFEGLNSGDIGEIWTKLYGAPSIPTPVKGGPEHHISVLKHISSPLSRQMVNKMEFMRACTFAFKAGGRLESTRDSSTGNWMRRESEPVGHEQEHELRIHRIHRNSFV